LSAQERAARARFDRRDQSAEAADARRGARRRAHARRREEASRTPSTIRGNHALVW
jgi:hypothetical protein